LLKGNGTLRAAMLGMILTCRQRTKHSSIC
jgi:hypothetical protein